jgi:glycosyltransferase involved in cell wall biosynthesis
VTSICVVIPARNEGALFGARLVGLADHFAPYQRSYQVSYVIVDDASTDETVQIAKRFARYRDNVTLIVHDRRYGIGHALRSAFVHVHAEYTIVMDGSLSYTPYAAMQLLEALEDTGADMAAAKPYARGTERIVNRILSLLARGRCGSFTCILRAFRTAFLKRLAFSSEGHDAIPELMFCAMRADGRILEMAADRDWIVSESRERAHPLSLDALHCLWPALRLGAAILTRSPSVATQRGFHL